MKVFLLHYKYVRNYAIFELNLSSAVRKKWQIFVFAHLKVDIEEERSLKDLGHRLWRIPSNIMTTMELENESEEKMDDDAILARNVSGINAAAMAISDLPVLIDQYSCQESGVLCTYAMKISHKNSPQSLNMNYDEILNQNIPELNEEFACELLYLIEKVMDECYRLMKDSFVRYDEKNICKQRQIEFGDILTLAKKISNQK